MKIANDRLVPARCALWVARSLPMLLLPVSAAAQVMYGTGYRDPYLSGPTRPFDNTPRNGVYSAVPSPRYDDPPPSLPPMQGVGAASYAPDPQTIWRGIYAGALFAHRWSNTESDKLGLGSLQTKGWQFGAALGHNFQTGNWVYGVEGDFLVGNSANALAASGVSLSYRDTWTATLRGRFGYTSNATLFYATGGAAFAGQDLSAATQTYSASLGSMRSGMVWGAGIETKLTASLAARIEGLHYSYRDAALNSGLSSAATPPVLKFDSNVLRAGLIYKFN